MSPNTGVGRPPIFRKKDIPKMRSDIEYWLNSKRVVRPMFDKDGNPVLDANGVQATETYWINKPTEYEMCNKILGCTSATWATYCDKEKHPEFQELVTWVKDQMKDFLFEDGITAKSSSMHQFILANNYGMKTEKKEVEIGKETREAAVKTIEGLNERLAYLRDVAKDENE